MDFDEIRLAYLEGFFKLTTLPSRKKIVRIAVLEKTARLAIPLAAEHNTEDALQRRIQHLWSTITQRHTLLELYLLGTPQPEPTDDITDSVIAVILGDLKLPNDVQDQLASEGKGKFLIALVLRDLALRSIAPPIPPIADGHTEISPATALHWWHAFQSKGPRGRVGPPPPPMPQPPMMMPMRPMPRRMGRVRDLSPASSSESSAASTLKEQPGGVWQVLRSVFCCVGYDTEPGEREPLLRRK